MLPHWGKKHSGPSADDYYIIPRSAIVFKNPRHSKGANRLDDTLTNERESSANVTLTNEPEINDNCSPNTYKTVSNWLDDVQSTIEGEKCVNFPDSLYTKDVNVDDANDDVKFNPTNDFDSFEIEACTSNHHLFEEIHQNDDDYNHQTMNQQQPYNDTHVNDQTKHEEAEKGRDGRLVEKNNFYSSDIHFKSYTSNRDLFGKTHGNGTELNHRTQYEGNNFWNSAAGFL